MGRVDDLRQVFLVWAFRILLFMAILAAFFNGNWVNLLISLFVLVISFPVFIGRKKDVSGLEFLILFFVFVLIYFGNVGFFSGLFWWWDLFIRFVLGILAVLVGFLLIFIINDSRKGSLNLNSFFIALFCFSFALMSALCWLLIKFLAGYFFGLNLFASIFEVELWGVLIFCIGAFFASLLGFIHLKFFRNSFIRKPIMNLLRKNPEIFRGVVDSEDYVGVLVKKGESEVVEFKSALRTNLFTKEHDKRIEHSVLKTIVAFLNTSGGNLLIGVSDEGRVIGIGVDGFRSKDRFSLHLTNLIEKNIGRSVFSSIRIDFFSFHGEDVCVVSINKLRKPVFLNYSGHEEFYVRFGPSSVKLTGSKLVDFIKRKK